MPGCGWGARDLGLTPTFEDNALGIMQLTQDALMAARYGLFYEWLEWFVGGLDAGMSTLAASSGALCEWDVWDPHWGKFKVAKETRDDA